MLAHHRAVALEAAAGEDDGVGGEGLARAARFDHDAGDAAVLARERLRRAAVAQHDTRHFRRAGERRDDRRAAAGRLDARWSLGEVVGRLDELDAVAGDPLHGCGRVVREPREIGLVALELRRRQHVVHEARLDAVGCGHAHVGRRPAGVAAGLLFGRLLDQRDGRGDRARTRLFGGGQRGGEPRCAVADDDNLERLAAHPAPSRVVVACEPWIIVAQVAAGIIVSARLLQNSDDIDSPAARLRPPPCAT